MVVLSHKDRHKFSVNSVVTSVVRQAKIIIYTLRIKRNNQNYMINDFNDLSTQNCKSTTEATTWRIRCTATTTQNTIFLLLEITGQKSKLHAIVAAIRKLVGTPMRQIDAYYLQRYVLNLIQETARGESAIDQPTGVTCTATSRRWPPAATMTPSIGATSA